MASLSMTESSPLPIFSSRSETLAQPAAIAACLAPFQPDCVSVTRQGSLGLAGLRGRSPVFLFAALEEVFIEPVPDGNIIAQTRKMQLAP